MVAVQAKRFVAVLLLSFGANAFADLQSGCEFTSGEARSDQIATYSSVQMICRSSSYDWYAIRQIQTLKKESVYLAVDPDTLNTKLIRASCLSCSNSQSPPADYGTLLAASLQNSQPLQNAGVKHSLKPVRSPLLTVDLCPSRKGFEKRLFDALLNSNIPRPIPVGLAITGKWMQAHAAEMKYLLGLESSGQIEIWWINHSHSHPYSKSRALKTNFLLSPGVNFQNEVMSTETQLIANGLTPSVFFRFPGLVSSQTLVQTLGSWGLVTLGSDAWLAKGETPKAGSVILVHGNGNEPGGIDIFLRSTLQNLNDLSSLEEAFAK